MSIDTREIRDTVAETQDTAANVATGAIVGIVETATNPIGAVRRTVRRLDRQGDPVNTQVRRRAARTRNEVVEVVDDVVSGNFAERVALSGIRTVKARARRKDIVGDVLYVGLNWLHQGLQGTLRELNKFEDAAEPPVRNGERGRSTGPARSATRSRRRTSGTRARAAARTSARRTASSARTTARRTVRAARKSA